MGMLSTNPNEDPYDADVEFHRFVDAIERVMGPAKPGDDQPEQHGPGWLSGPCPTPTEQVSETPAVTE